MYNFNDELYIQAGWAYIDNLRGRKTNDPVLKQPRLRLGTARGAVVFRLHVTPHPAVVKSTLIIDIFSG